MRSIHPKYGHIIGGNCDRVHQARRARERGGESAIAWLQGAGAIRHIGGGWWRFTERETKAERRLGWREIEAIAGGGTDTKIGSHRVFQDLAPLFRKRGKSFRLSYLRKCVEDLAGVEFAISAESPLGPFAGGYRAPHQDGIYQARKADGDLAK